MSATNCTAQSWESTVMYLALCLLIGCMTYIIHRRR